MDHACKGVPHSKGLWTARRPWAQVILTKGRNAPLSTSKDPAIKWSYQPRMSDAVMSKAYADSAALVAQGNYNSPAQL